MQHAASCLCSRSVAYEAKDPDPVPTGIPNCICIGPTNTLAKTANKMARKGPGVVDLSVSAARNDALDAFALGDVWGVGRKWEAKLQAIGIATAGQVRDAPDGLLLENFGVVLARTQRELKGEACHQLEEVEPDLQQTMVSRSFGERVEDREAVTQAVATFAARIREAVKARTHDKRRVGVRRH